MPKIYVTEDYISTLLLDGPEKRTYNDEVELTDEELQRGKKAIADFEAWQEFLFDKVNRL